jgi:RNA polymerase sigma-70 factor (ECF subfamily)
VLSETDKYLISGIKAGDYQAFETLFNSYYKYLVNVARFYVNSDEIAEDLVQDLFVKIWEQPSILDINTSIKGYLYRSIYNSCINYILRKQHRFTKIDSSTEKKLLEFFTANPEDLPETGIKVSELNSAILQALGQLPPECRKIFLMSREEDLSHKAIALNLNISENTVKVQIHRALSRLREMLADYL